MRLRHIEVFHAVYSCGSVSNAARLLNVSQPSVSKVLRHAEDQLGYMLFNRVKGKLVPTGEARQLFPEVSKLYENLDGIRRIAENLANINEGIIRLAVTPALGLRFIPSIVSQFIKSRKGVKFEIETLHHGEISQAILEKKVDIGFAFDNALHPAVMERNLGYGEFVCLSHKSNPLTQSDRVSLNDLEGKDFISLNSNSPLGRLLMAQVGAACEELNIVANVETYHIAHALVSNGLGHTIVDEITAKASSDENVIIQKLEPAIKFSVTALHHREVPLSLVSQGFLDYVSKHTDKMWLAS